MPDAYFIRFRGHVKGPYSADQLRELARRGAFGRLHEVSEDNKSWRRASEYPDLLPRPSVAADRRRSSVQVASTTPLANTSTPPGEYALSTAPGQSGENQTIDAANAASATWFYTDGTREIGPVPFEELQSAAARGHLLAADLVWTDGMDQWCEAARVSGLAFAPTAVTAAAVPEEGRGTSGMAVASLICGLLGITLLPGLGSLLAIVFGHLAISRIKRSRTAQGGMGLAVAGLALGYLVLIVTLVALVATILWLLLAPQPQA